MSSTACRQVEVGNFDQTQFVALGRRQLAQAQLLRLGSQNKSNRYRTILENNLIGTTLRSSDLFGSQRRRREINRAIVLSHVERNRRHLIKLNERSRQNVLARMLLHVIAAPFKVNRAAHGVARRQFWGRFQIMDNPAVVSVGHFRDSNSGIGACCQPPGVIHLSTAGGIERCFLQDDAGTGLPIGGRNYFQNDGIKFVKLRVGVVKPIRHGGPPTGQKKSGTGDPLHTKEPVTVASFRTWRGWRENVARDRCLTSHSSIQHSAFSTQPPPDLAKC